MAESEKVRFIKPGVTLIEMMVAMMIFSTVLGLATNLVKESTATPFISSHVEAWLTLIDETGIAVKELTGSASAWDLGVHQPPFSHLKKPKDLKLWDIKKRNCNPDLVMIEFTALTIQNKKLQWRFYKKTE